MQTYQLGDGTCIFRQIYTRQSSYSTKIENGRNKIHIIQEVVQKGIKLSQQNNEMNQH